MKKLLFLLIAVPMLCFAEIPQELRDVTATHVAQCTIKGKPYLCILGVKDNGEEYMMVARLDGKPLAIFQKKDGKLLLVWVDGVGT